MINALASPSFVAIQGLGKPSQPALFHVIETIIHIPVSYLLIRHLGGVGAAWAWFIRVAIDTILLQRASCSTLGISLMSWYRSIVIHGLLPIMTCGLFLFGLKEFNLSLFHPLSILGFITTIIVYFFLVWKRGLDTVGRDAIKGFLANFNNRKKIN
jgi:Na+-driven multidrug efflux pump